MPKTDQEVFDYFQTGYDDTPEVALIAYARYAKAKYDWVNHELAQSQQPPTTEEVERWIASLPNSRFDEIRDGALSMLRAISEDYMKPRTDEERAKAVESSILGRVDAAARRVERATSFWRNVVPATAIGVVSSFLLALILIAGSVIFQRDPTALAWISHSSRRPGLLCNSANPISYLWRMRGNEPEGRKTDCFLPVLDQISVAR